MKPELPSDEVITEALEISYWQGKRTIEKKIIPALAEADMAVQQIRKEADSMHSEGMPENEEQKLRALRLINEMYAGFRRCLIAMITYTQPPFTADMLLDPLEMERVTERELDEGVDRILAYVDGNMLRIRTPPLPHKSRPVVSVGGKNHKVVSTYAYREAVARVIDAHRDELVPVAKTMKRKTLHFLNVFEEGRFVADNDNRDTSPVTNSVCRILPGRDSPKTTRFVYDGVETSEIPAGTYITVLPYEQGLPDNNETISFWKSKLTALELTASEVGKT